MSIKTSLKVKLKRDNGTSYDVIEKSVSISGPGLSMETIDATHLNSADEFREYVAGFRDGGEINFTAHLDPESTDASKHLLVRQDLENGTLTNYRIVLPDGPYIQAKCLVTAWGPDFPEGGMVPLEGTLKVSGKPTYGDSEP